MQPGANFSGATRSGKVVCFLLLALAWAVAAQDQPDRAAALLRAGEFRAALEATSGVVNDPKLAQGPERIREVYFRGCAAFGLGDYAAAVRWLSELAPFDQQGEMGLH